MARAASTADEAESIYDLIEKEEKKCKKPPIYRSKYPGNLPPTCSTFGNIITSNVCGPTNMGGEIDFNCSRSHVQIGANFGPNATVPHPEVKKLTKGIDSLPVPKKFTYPDVGKRKESVPVAKGTHVISGLLSDSNFVTKNAIRNILMPTGERTPDPPKSIFKHENYGKIPDYLRANKELIEKEKQEEREDLKMQRAIRREQKRGHVLPENERLELLSELKEQWGRTNKEYQEMTHLVLLDTIGKVRKKERYESLLAQLEKDIDTLSKPNIVITGTGH